MVLTSQGQDTVPRRINGLIFTMGHKERAGAGQVLQKFVKHKGTKVGALGGQSSVHGQSYL